MSCKHQRVHWTAVHGRMQNGDNHLRRQTHTPSGLRFQGSIPHTCERRQSWPCQWCRRPPPRRHHGGCQCRCITPSGGTWAEIPYTSAMISERKRATDRESSSLLEQLQDGQDNVIDVAKSRGFRLLGVMETASPVDGDVCLLLVQLHCSS